MYTGDSLNESTAFVSLLIETGAIRASYPYRVESRARFFCVRFSVYYRAERKLS